MFLSIICKFLFYLPSLFHRQSSLLKDVEVFSLCTTDIFILNSSHLIVLELSVYRQVGFSKIQRPNCVDLRETDGGTIELMEVNPGPGRWAPAWPTGRRRFSESQKEEEHCVHKAEQVSPPFCPHFLVCMGFAIEEITLHQDHTAQ